MSSRYPQIRPDQIKDATLTMRDFVQFNMSPPLYDEENRVSQIVEVGVNSLGETITYTHTFTYPNPDTTIITCQQTGGKEGTLTIVKTIVLGIDGLPTVAVS